MKKFFIIIIIISTLVFIHTKQAATLSVAVPDKIRVALVEDAQVIELAIKGPYKITTIETGEVLKQGDVLWQGKFSAIDNGIHLKTYKDEDFKIYGLNIIPENQPSIYVGKNLYRGQLQIIKTKNGMLSAVNILNIEDYIKGVLYHEISQRWPIEAIKAQAVASRTFAIYQAQQRFDKDYYLSADVRSQVYKGVFAEKYRTNEAIKATAGEILMYKNKVLPAFFHSVCGGQREKASNLWKVSLKPLNGGKCHFCKNAPLFYWEESILLDKIEKSITKAKGAMGEIKSIKILSRNSSGRVKTLRISGNKILNVSGKEFRHILGAKVLKSTNFSVTIKGNRAYFKGYGWGHGVGMCQWGAFAMAKKRYDYKQILEHYYPGAGVVKLKNETY